MLHRLAHWLGLHRLSQHLYEQDGHLWLSVACRDCGRLERVAHTRDCWCMRTRRP